MATKAKTKKELTPEQKAEIELKREYTAVRSGIKKIDDVDEELKGKIAGMVADDLVKAKKDLEEEFESQKKMELIKLEIAVNQAKRIDKVSDIAYSYYQYTGCRIDPKFLANCVEELESHVAAAATIVADWTFEQFCADNDVWENPMNDLLPIYVPGDDVNTVWWLTYLFHDMSGHGTSASQLHLKIDTLIEQTGGTFKDDLRKLCVE